MTDQTPTLFVPLDVAEEIRALRAEVAALTAVVAPLAKNGGWMTPEEAAAEAGVSVATINRWAQRGIYERTGSGRARKVRPAQPQQRAETA